MDNPALSRISRSTVQHTFTYGCAAGLVAYARTNQAFGSWFSSMVLHTCAMQVDGTYALPPVESIAPLIPDSDTCAVRRAVWLLSLIETDVHEYALGRSLYTWARAYEREDPKAIVLGIEIGILPIGLMGKMKIRREPMSVLVRRDYVETLFTRRGTDELVRSTTSIVEQGLIRAHGTTRRLEPDLADWLFGEKSLRYSIGQRPALHEALKEVRELDAPHACINDTSGVAVVVVTPAVNVDHLRIAAELSSLQA